MAARDADLGAARRRAVPPPTDIRARGCPRAAARPRRGAPRRGGAVARTRRPRAHAHTRTGAHVARRRAQLRLAGGWRAAVGARRLQRARGAWERGAGMATKIAQQLYMGQRTTRQRRAARPLPRGPRRRAGLGLEQRRQVAHSSLHALQLAPHGARGARAAAQPRGAPQRALDPRAPRARARLPRAPQRVGGALQLARAARLRAAAARALERREARAQRAGARAQRRGVARAERAERAARAAQPRAEARDELGSARHAWSVRRGGAQLGLQRAQPRARLLQRALLPAARGQIGGGRAHKEREREQREHAGGEMHRGGVVGAEAGRRRYRGGGGTGAAAARRPRARALA
ncbi:ABC transporter periplasmic substrate-binding protein [Gracilaria domingensis]|nr:ABC transporter periplasmic substrate-binding protein [Gracilaria domingensis]